MKTLTKILFYCRREEGSMKLRKNVLVTLGILVAIGGGTSYADSNIEPNSRRCPISTSYSESSVSRSKSEQL